MGYRFTRADRSVRSGVRRLALERIDQSLAVLHAPGPPTPEGLHRLRKNVKKLRGLLRLLRPVLPEFDAENDALRRAGRLISGLRDGDVLQGLLTRLAQDAGLNEGTARRLERAVAELAAPHTATAEAALDEHRLILTALRVRAARWSPQDKGFDALAPGLRKTLSQARRAFATWCETQDMDDLHRLRKRLKEHWYHARLLERLWPPMMAAHIAVAEELCETLGLARDHVLLAQALSGVEGAEPVIERALAEATILRARAMDLGTRMLAEKPAALVTRWQVWWRLGFA